MRRDHGPARAPAKAADPWMRSTAGSGRLVPHGPHHSHDPHRSADARAARETGTGGALSRFHVTGRGAASARRRCGCVDESEGGFRDAVKTLAEFRGWRVYYVPDSRRSEAGWPDLVLARGGVVLFRELKTKKGRVRKDQVWWMRMLWASGADTGVWRPDDWPEIRRTLEAEWDRSQS